MRFWQDRPNNRNGRGIKSSRSDRSQVVHLLRALEAWEELVSSVERGYTLEFTDYLDEPGIRNVLAGAMDSSREALSPDIVGRVEAADSRMKDATVELEEPIHGTPPPTRWWWYRLPRKAHTTFLHGALSDAVITKADVPKFEEWEPWSTSA